MISHSYSMFFGDRTELADLRMYVPQCFLSLTKVLENMVPSPQHRHVIHATSKAKYLQHRWVYVITSVQQPSISCLSVTTMLAPLYTNQTTQARPWHQNTKAKVSQHKHTAEPNNTWRAKVFQTASSPPSACRNLLWVHQIPGFSQRTEYSKDRSHTKYGSQP